MNEQLLLNTSTKRKWVRFVDASGMQPVISLSEIWALEDGCIIVEERAEQTSKARLQIERLTPPPSPKRTVYSIHETLMYPGGAQPTNNKQCEICMVTIYWGISAWIQNR
jgi:hypothetical protein